MQVFSHRPRHETCFLLKRNVLFVQVEKFLYEATPLIQHTYNSPLSPKKIINCRANAFAYLSLSNSLIQTPQLSSRTAKLNFTTKIVVLGKNNFFIQKINSKLTINEKLSYSIMKIRKVNKSNSRKK